MQERLGKEYPAFLTSYGRPPEKGLRVNTLKLSAEEFASRAPFPLGEKTAWEEDGFYISEEKPGGDVYHFAGLYYLQEPSAMCAAPLLGAGKGERVLDLCAAPGGKTVQLAAGMGGSGVLIANEIVYDRAKILSQNVERMGIADCAVTSASPARLKESFPAYFDKILVDAPCSGEGMFKKEKNAVPEWSEELIARYVKSGLPMDKAGAYGIQDGFPLVKAVEGSYTNVVGLPTEEVGAILQALGGETC